MNKITQAATFIHSCFSPACYKSVLNATNLMTKQPIYRQTYQFNNKAPLAIVSPDTDDGLL